MNVKIRFLSVCLSLGFLGFFPAVIKAQEKKTAPDLDRTVLPIKEPQRQTYSELDIRNTTPPPRFEVKAPKGAPNVVIVLIDDMGFGVSEAFGGPVATPTMNKLADNGIKYNRFHTTALCSPTRVALLTGYNHHSNNMGCIAEAATTFPGNTGVRPQPLHQWPKYCVRMDTIRLRLVSITKPHLGKFLTPAQWIVGQRIRVSKNFMVSLVEKPINGHP